jgi:hypothetical protein
VGDPLALEGCSDAAVRALARRRTGGNVSTRIDAAADRQVAMPATLDASRGAWLAAVPTAALTLAAIVFLGPSAAQLLPTAEFTFWPEILAGVRPEPTEHARYLIALAAPLLLTTLTVLLVRRPPRALAARAIRLSESVELVAVLVIAICFIAQRTQAGQDLLEPGHVFPYFSLPTVLVAAAIAASVTAATRSPAIRALAAKWAPDARMRRAGAALLAVTAIAIVLLPAINTDRSIANAIQPIQFHLEFTYDESVAVLAGRSPLGDFATQYSSLWPYALAAGLSLLGNSVGVFTGLLALLSGMTLLALFDVLRRVARSSIAGLLLFGPLLATSAFRFRYTDNVQHFSLVNYFGVLPLRYAGPFLLAWLVARHLDGSRPRRTWPLFLVGGLAVLNNSDFGLAAVGATIAALLWTRERRSTRDPGRLALEAGLGLGAALALVVVLLLVRTGSPPDVSLMFRYARIFMLGGFSMVPMRPVVGLNTIILLTYVATIGVATVRALRHEPDRLMTGLLAWIGIFGLGQGAYYIGHSLSEVLVYSFPCWALAVTLLTILVVRSLAAQPHRRPRPAELACLFAFGLLACSIAQISSPWAQAQRIAADGEPMFAQPVGQAFVAAHTRRGESVLIMTTLGHRIAVNLDLDDVEMYTGTRSLQTEEQLEDSIGALSRAGGHKAFVLASQTYPALIGALQRNFRLQAESSEGMQLWVVP